MPEPKNPTRDHWVANVRVRYLLRSVGALFYDAADEFGLEGDAVEGSFVDHDGSGNHQAIFWNAEGVVALAFDHDNPESEFSLELDERKPERHLHRLPPDLSALAEKACGWGERLATAAAWSLSDRSASSWSPFDTSLRAYGLAPEDAMLAWLELLSLDESHGRLALRLAELGKLRRVALGEADAVIALAPPAVSNGRPPNAEAVARAVEKLVKAGIDWPGAVESAQSLDARRAAERAARLGPNIALHTAANEGDVEGVARALALGANIDALTEDEELPRVLAGENALALAFLRGHREVVEYLLEHEATLVSRMKTSSPLGWAVSRGWVGMVRRLIEEGPPVSVHAHDGRTGSLLAHAVAGNAEFPNEKNGSRRDYVEIIRLLLDRGAPLPRQFDCNQLVELVERGGAPELVARLQPPPLVPVQRLPDAVAPANTANDLERLKTLLDETATRLRDGKREFALEALEDAWRLSRHPRIAEAIESARGVRHVWATNYPKAIKLVEEWRAKALEPATPMQARAILVWLMCSTNFDELHAVALAEDAAAALLVHLMDLRFAASLRDHCRRNRPDGSSPPVRESLMDAARALESFIPPTLDQATSETLSEIEDRLTNHKRSPGARSVRDLFLAVYDDPRTDEPRLALAERLEASGDPRGEFIRLQLERHGTKAMPTKREQELQKTHARAWLGEISPVIADVVFARGFAWQVGSGDTSGDKLASTSPALGRGAGRQDEWATVERLTLWRHANWSSPSVHGIDLLEGPRLQRLRELTDASGHEVRAIAEGSPRPLEILELFGPRMRGNIWHGDTYEVSLRRALTNLPELRELRMPAAKIPTTKLFEIASCAKKLRALAVGAEEGRIPEIVAAGRAAGLASIAVLGRFDVRFEVEPRTLVVDVAFDGTQGEPAALAIAALASERPTSVLVHAPPRATITEGKIAPVLSRKGGWTLDLANIWKAADRLGIPAKLEPSTPHWSGSPERDR